MKFVNVLVENGIITEQKCGSNFAYTLADNSLFLPTEYKVLQSQDDQCFIKCMKIMYNGKIQFYYLLDEYRSFAQMIPHLDADGFMVIVTNVLADILDVKNNGFLSCQKLDISFEHIYVDINTYKVKLIYLPINKSFYIDDASFENVFRTSLIKLLTSVQTVSSSKTLKFMSDLSNGRLSLNDLYEAAHTGKVFEQYENSRVFTTQQYQRAESTTSESRMKIVSLNAPDRIILDIDKGEYVIGKKAGSVDGVLAFNKMISRVHCKIVQKQNQFFVEDLQSANGTYVNYEKLIPNRLFPLKNGDRIRLANSDFEVVIE